MNYLPKSKLGAVMSALYLLFVFGLVLGSKYEPNLIIWFGLFTLPLSILSALFIWLNPWRDAELILKIYVYLFFIMPFVGVFFNAAIIYLVVGFVSKALQSLSKPS